MKQDIHPKLNTNVVVTCACGNTFTTISTNDSITVDICSVCHPFYTGKAKFVDVEGRIEKFNKKKKLMEDKKTQSSKKLKAQTANDTLVKAQPSLKDMLDQARSTK